MKKSVLVGVLVVGMGFHGFAQGFPVIDITGVLTAIENGYTLYEQLQAAYNNIKANYDQLKQTIKNFESFDMNNLDAKDPLGSWRSLMTYADRMLTYEENMERIIKRKDIKIGNGSYSFEDIFTSSPSDTAKNMLVDGGTFVAVDPFEKKLTDREKAMFNQRYGLSYGRYMRYSKMTEMIQKKAAQSAAYSNEWQKGLGEDRQRLQTLMNDGFENDSAVKQLQLQNAQMQGQAQDIKTITKTLGDIATLQALNAAQAQEQTKMEQESRNSTSLDLSEGFVEMLKIDNSKLE